MLTDYERLAEFVPNLERCERLPRGPNGRVRLRQVCDPTAITVLLRMIQSSAAHCCCSP